MFQVRNGSVRLFRLFGIDVSLHWSWAIVAAFQMQDPIHKYHSPLWNAAEYLTLFLIVLMHEFGHALACRSVGGQAEHITLWPLGGVAYVAPPPRPGPVLWSIAAGPLVNVLLVPVTISLAYFLPVLLPRMSDDFANYLGAIAVINLSLLIFNMLPIYPLDGGQIFQSLLWFFIGRARSLLVATSLGLVATAAFLGLIAWRVIVSGGDFGGMVWIAAIAAFLAMNSWSGFKRARAMLRLAKLPRNLAYRCPACREAPPTAPMWQCACGGRFDTFLTNAACPHCAARFDMTACPLCGTASPFDAWQAKPTGFPVSVPGPSPLPPAESTN